MEIAVESLEKSWNEMICLAVDRWHERGGVKFTPSYNEHVKKEKEGRLSLVAARVKGEMVGYAIRGEDESHFILPHYRNSESSLLKFAA